MKFIRHSQRQQDALYNHLACPMRKNCLIRHTECHYKGLQAMFLCRMNFTVSIDGKDSQEKTAKNG